MKKRLPRKLKKAMLTKQRLLNKSLGFKYRRAIMKIYMYQKYLSKLYGIRTTYNKPITLEDTNITLEDLKFSLKLEHIINKYISPA